MSRNCSNNTMTKCWSWTSAVTTTSGYTYCSQTPLLLGFNYTEIVQNLQFSLVDIKTIRKKSDITLFQLFTQVSSQRKILLLLHTEQRSVIDDKLAVSATECLLRHSSIYAHSCSQVPQPSAALSSNLRSCITCGPLKRLMHE